MVARLTRLHLLALHLRALYLTVELQLTPAHQVLVEGLGVPTDEERGVALLRRAERAGNAQAQYELGVALYTGEVKLKLNLKWSVLLEHAAACCMPCCDCRYAPIVGT